MSGDFWERAARTDPLWAILSDPAKRGRQWKLDQFLETGRREVSLLLYQLRQLGQFPRTRRALDFGCGVGRLTQALAGTFREVIGVDVSPTMIRLAGELSRGLQSVRYIVDQSSALTQFESGEFDFIYSDIVLQHVEPDAARRYIAEFSRVLAPGGVVVFQLPSHRRLPSEQPKAPVQMAPEHYRAGIRLVEAPPASMRSGQSAVALVDIRNDSPLAWDQEHVGVIRLGNHWRRPDGTMMVQDDGRTRLPNVLNPGAAVRLSLDIGAPADSGEFECEFDLVHEGVSWFGDLGSSTASAPVVVTSPSDGSGITPTDTTSTMRETSAESVDIYALLPPGAGQDIGTFPMHGVPRDDVIGILEQNAASLFLIEEDARAGPEWHSYRYFARKT